MDEKEVVEHEGLLWDEQQSWRFPNLATADEDCGGINLKLINEMKSKKAAAAGKGKKRIGAGSGESAEDHGLHIWTERERRKKMRNMFSNLHALLPHIPPKADKSTIVDEAVKHIRKLQLTVEELERRKEEAAADSSSFITHTCTNLTDPNPNPNPMMMMSMSMSKSMMMGVGVGVGVEYPRMFRTWTSPNVILNICGRDAHISVCSIRKPGLLTALCFLMDKNNLDLVSAQASSDRATCIYMIHARANGCSEQFQQTFTIEEIFKQAAAEIIMFLNA